MSMKAIVSSDGQVNFEVSGESEKDLFQSIARVQEVFSHSVCGRCKTQNTKFVSRLDKDDNDWLEIKCQEKGCGAKLIFGQAKKGGVIYPKIRWGDLSDKQKEQRSDEREAAEKNNGYLPNGGWFVFRG